MDNKIMKCVSITFCVKLGKSSTIALNMFFEAFGEYSLSGQLFLNDTRVSRLVEYQLKMTNVQGDQASEK
jgi:hypothetical protein